MYHKSAKETAAIAGATLIAGGYDQELSHFVIDSRQVSPGDTFVCFKGETQNGNDYAPGAIEAGAAAVVITQEPDEALIDLAQKRACCLMRADLDDAELFLRRVAGWYRKQHRWAVIGVTGSVGKTTTKDMLAEALATRYKVHKNVGNFNSVIGVPLTILEAPDDTQVFVCEMGMNHPQEIDRICECARPQLACITNIGTSHIGLLGSRENIARAKAECVVWLADPLPTDVPVAPALYLTSADDKTPFLQSEYAAKHGVTCHVVGEHEGDYLAAGNVTLNDDGKPSFDVVGSGQLAHVTLNLPGRQTVPDFLLAAAIAHDLGVSLNDSAAAIGAMQPAAMRVQVQSSPRGFRVIDDSYNASPASLAAALDLLCHMSASGRHIAVIGEVGELGSEAPRLHGLMGAFIAAKPLDFVVLVGGPNARIMQDAALTMGMSEDKLALVADAHEAARIMEPELGAGDLVLAKGSRAVGLDQFVREVLS